MKKLILISLVLSTVCSFGQNDQKAKACKLKVSSLSIGGGNLNFADIGINFDQFKNFTINKGSFFTTDVSGYERLYNDKYFSSGQFNLKIGFAPYNKKKQEFRKNQEFQVGINFSRGDRSSISFRKETEIAGDTFISGTQKIYSDTSIVSKIKYTEKTDVFGIDFSYSYKTNVEKRLSLSAGYGVSIGYSINPKLSEISSSDTTLILNFNDTEFNYGERHSRNSGNSDKEKETVARSSFFAGIYIPLGLNFRISKKREIWNQMNIFIQSIYGLEYQYVMNYKAYIRPFIGGGMGFRYNL
ncbi:MAG: hypothetical protein PHD97_12970 [Bacteroidales bacterium]|nr:hypothetical protein [Bacteroidales bacterium]